MTTQTATLITFAIARDDGKTRTLRGWTLPDGRVITYGTGVDGRDSLWASAAAVEACGLDRVESYEIGDDTTLIPLLVLVGADKDNVEYGGASLLTAAELAD